MRLARLALAIIFAPLAAPSAWVIMMYVNAFGATEPDPASYFGFGATFGYLGLFVGGIPVFMWFRRRQPANLTGLTLAGAIAGIVISLVSLFVIGLLLESDAGYNLFSIVYGALAGASVALCFGLIAGVENLYSPGE